MLFFSGMKLIMTFAMIAIIGLSMVTTSAYAQTTIPSWVKHTALWWGQGQISDSEFVKAIQYLIDHGIIVISQVPTTKQSSLNDLLPSASDIGPYWDTNSVTQHYIMNGFNTTVSNSVIVYGLSSEVQRQYIYQSGDKSSVSIVSIMEFDSPNSVNHAFNEIISNYRQTMIASSWDPMQPDPYIQYYGAQRHSGQYVTYDLILHNYQTIVVVEMTGDMPNMDDVTVQIAQNIMGKMPRITLP